MKTRILSVAAAAVMLFSGCGKSEGSPEKNEKTLAAEVSDNLDGGDYDISFSISGGGSFDGLAVRIARSGDNGVVEMLDGGVLTQFVKADNKTTMLLPEILCYQRTDYPGSFGNAFIKLGADDKLVSESETDGVITEVYDSPADEGGATDTFTFEFDSSTKQLLRIKQETAEGETNIEILEIKWECDPISLPDLSTWDDISEDALVSETTQLKFFLYYTLGITEQELNDFGYTYDQIAHMDQEAQQAFFEELDARVTEN